jgi:hypothetical protein
VLRPVGQRRWSRAVGCGRRGLRSAASAVAGGGGVVVVLAAGHLGQAGPDLPAAAQRRPPGGTERRC